MTDRLSTNPADYVVPLNINKLEGRMMVIPSDAGKHRNILLVPDHHALLERWWSLAENFADYGTVSMPDLPGFGGMDSFASIGIRPSIDAQADYLAAFVKLRYKRKRITLVGVSYGFVVITRMLQKYPILTRKVDLVINMGGFMHKDDFVYSPMKRQIYRITCRVLATKPLCFLGNHLFLNYTMIKFIDSKLPNSKKAAARISKEENDAITEFKARLWQVTDLRTNWLTMGELLNIDNCRVRLDLPVIHVVTKTDLYLDNDIVKEHMLVVYTSYKKYIAKNPSHGTSMIANKKEAGVMLPPALRRALNKSS